MTPAPNPTLSHRLLRLAMESGSHAAIKNLEHALVVIMANTREQNIPLPDYLDVVGGVFRSNLEKCCLAVNAARQAQSANLG